MTDLNETKGWYRYRDAIGASTRLAQQHEDKKALELLDDAIASAVDEGEYRWVLTLSHHAAVIARFIGDWPRVRRYYEKSLAVNPENAQAFSGLADVAQEQGDFEQAKQYAARCYKSLTQGDDFLREARIETLLKKWPDVASY